MTAIRNITPVEGYDKPKKVRIGVVDFNIMQPLGAGRLYYIPILAVAQFLNLNGRNKVKILKNVTSIRITGYKNSQFVSIGSLSTLDAESQHYINLVYLYRQLKAVIRNGFNNIREEIPVPPSASGSKRPPPKKDNMDSLPDDVIAAIEEETAGEIAKHKRYVRYLENKTLDKKMLKLFEIEEQEDAERSKNRKIKIAEIKERRRIGWTEK